MNDGHRAAGARGTELFAEDSCFTARYGRMIETAGIDGDRVPAPNRIEPLSRTNVRDFRAGVGKLHVSRTELTRIRFRQLDSGKADANALQRNLRVRFPEQRKRCGEVAGCVMLDSDP